MMYVLVSPIRKTLYVYRDRRPTDPPPVCSPSRNEPVLDQEATRLATVKQVASGLHLSMLHLNRDCGYLAKAAQPDARIVEIDQDSPLVAGLQVCKRCLRASGQIEELETLYNSGWD